MFVVLAALALVPLVLADGYNGLFQALNASGLDRFAYEVKCLEETPFGQSVLSQLSQGNCTIFAPTDEAWSSVNPSLIQNQTYLADLIAYHIVSGNLVNETQTYPNVTIGRTLLNDSALVSLPGNEPQVLIWSKSNDGPIFVQNQGGNISVVNTTNYNDTAILAVNSVLVPPPNMSAIFNNASYDLTTVGGILQSTTFQNNSQNNVSLLQILESAHGVTVFAPNNEGVQAAQGNLSGYSGNVTALRDILSNHVINGTTLYSSQISNRTSIVSAGGQVYAFISNATGLFVSVGRSNAVQIVERNILASNGVIQVVNGVMLNPNADPAAASSAYASATSVAAHVSGYQSTVTEDTTTHTGSSETGPSETGSSETGSSATTTTSQTATSTSAAKGRTNDWKLGMLAGMLVGFVHRV